MIQLDNSRCATRTDSAIPSISDAPVAKVARPLSVLTALTMLLLAACATATDPAGGANQATSAEGTEYRISPEDVLEISVWREDELTREVIVRPDGGISYPLVGSVAAAGKTAPELESALKAQLEEYIPDAVVSVSVKEIRGLKIFVTGQVRKPGQFLVGRYVDVLQALTLAGGLTPFSDKKNIRIIRRSNGAETVFTFNYNEVQKGARLEQNILLQPGDTVIVP